MNPNAPPTQPTFSPAELQRLQQLLQLFAAHKIRPADAAAWIQMLVSKGRQPDLPPREFEKWIEQFTSFFVNAVASEIIDDYLYLLGAVPALAAPDVKRIRTYAYGLLTRDVTEQRRLALELARQHVRQIRQLATHVGRGEAIRQYFAAHVPGAEPPSVGQLVDAQSIHATPIGNMVTWKMPIAYRLARIQGIERVTGSTSFGTVFGVYYFLTGDFDGAIAAAETAQVLLGPAAAHGEARGQTLHPQGPPQERDRGREIGSRTSTGALPVRLTGAPSRATGNTGTGSPTRATSPVQQQTVNRAGSVPSTATARSAPSPSARAAPKPAPAPPKAPAAKPAAPAAKPAKPIAAPVAKPAKPEPSGPPPAARAAMATALRGDDAAIDAAWKLFERFPQKLSRDSGTVTRVAELYRTTRQMPTLLGKLRTFIQNRADAGELRAIVQLLQNPRVKSLRLLEPVQEKGARTPDVEIMYEAGYQDAAQKKLVSLRVEITTVTSATRSVRTRGHTSADLPASERGKSEAADRVASPDAVVEAVRRKLDRQQAVDGIVVVNLPYETEPGFGPAHRDAVERVWKNHPKGKGTVREIWLILPRAAPGESRLRVIVSGGLGIASL